MLCHLCETFLNIVLHQDLTPWGRVENVWFTFKHGDNSTVKAAAETGCELCALFNQLRAKGIPDYENLDEKWHVHPASIDVKHEYDSTNTGSELSGPEPRSRWTFQLLTVAPEMSWIPFEIFKPKVAASFFGEDAATRFDWPFAVSASPDTAEAIELARNWVACCLGSHPSCVRPERASLPTRVIEVGYSDGVPAPRLRVTHGHLGRYVTLSHCWGTGDRLTLIKRNLHAFQLAIPFEDLPKTFQDAMRLTMSLGVRYLWIDALCIIQDDVADWQQESGAMCAVFANALFSISALAATDSHSGMLHARVLPQTTVQVGDVKVGIRSRLDNLQEAMRKSRLGSRAWCFQENLLPRAILHVGANEMYWDCRTCTVSESEHTTRDTSRQTMHPHGDAPRKATFITRSEDWLGLVKEYSERQVTRPSDRLPAIAGLADKARNEVGSTYIQGLWADDLHAGLLWRRQKAREKYAPWTSARTSDLPQVPIASSWSWASINDAVMFPVHSDFTVRAIRDSDASFQVFGEHSSHQSAKSLALKGFLKRGSCRPLAGAPYEPEAAMFRSSGSLLSDDGLICYLDYVSDPFSRGCYCFQVAEWNRPIATEASKRTIEESTRGFYLVLERIQDASSDIGFRWNSSGSFKRTGMGYDLPSKVHQLFLNAERQQLLLF
ncbi:hypothetical protein LTR37_007934 [Vermiconidia calcicola]|uniref:Uncharacterized protein n=1 Tax=Vermiconidia calcicola TaxID=1690605 RepID=A0ACC3NCE4_9PEZI|nr:hypothetical protein LTR37_007934 [Vermiconidia calcicola]